jgi:hypothetical protein
VLVPGSWAKQEIERRLPRAAKPLTKNRGRESPYWRADLYRHGAGADRQQIARLARKRVCNCSSFGKNNVTVVVGKRCGRGQTHYSSSSCGNREFRRSPVSTRPV